LKLAISGKGGTGKSTVAAGLALLLAEAGRRVLAIDADPDANLASALGITAADQTNILPIAARKRLVEERTGAKVRAYGQIFKLNPQVADLAEACGYSCGNITLLVLGAVDEGGAGCACPESVLLRALVQDVVLFKEESLVLDMEAGVEHLGRATASGVDTLLIVVEPGQRALDCAARVRRLAGEIGIRDVRAVANKIASDEEEAFVRAGLDGLDLIGAIPYSDDLRAADRNGSSVLDGASAGVREAFLDLFAALDRGA
jgi:CO dehydrogenase maturation factor